MSDAPNDKNELSGTHSSDGSLPHASNVNLQPEKELPLHENAAHQLDTNDEMAVDGPTVVEGSGEGHTEAMPEIGVPEYLEDTDVTIVDAEALLRQPAPSSAAEVTSEASGDAAANGQQLNADEALVSRTDAAGEGEAESEYEASTQTESDDSDSDSDDSDECVEIPAYDAPRCLRTLEDDVGRIIQLSANVRFVFFFHHLLSAIDFNDISKLLKDVQDELDDAEAAVPKTQNEMLLDVCHFGFKNSI
jgi:hypothetical protein